MNGTAFNADSSHGFLYHAAFAAGISHDFESQRVVVVVLGNSLKRVLFYKGVLVMCPVMSCQEFFLFGCVHYFWREEVTVMSK